MECRWKQSGERRHWQRGPENNKWVEFLLTTGKGKKEKLR
jgi:hypothetical protein